MSSKKKQEEETQVQLDQNSDSDDLIGDLIKEELQLLLTRMLKKNPNFEDELKQQTLKIIKSRQRVTPEEITKAPGRFFLKHGLPAGFPHPSLYAGMGEDLMQFEGVDVSAIKRKVNEAFKKDKHSKRHGYETFTVDTKVLNLEIKNAEDEIFVKGESRKGLTMLEALTSELINKGTVLGSKNCYNFEEMVEKLADHWTQAFLFEDLGLEEDEREEWFKKLQVWDRAANQEEGDFNTPRYAAKMGWTDKHLINVLKGDHLGKFKEPNELSIARLNHLERENKYEEAVNLASAVDLYNFHAKFLLKLKRIEEAAEVSKQIEDAEELFTIAQVCRSSNAKVAFDLALRSIAIDFKWNNEQRNRSTWICELAAANDLLDDLVSGLEEQVKHKTIQKGICDILRTKEQYKPALAISKYILKPFDEEKEEDENGELVEKKLTPEEEAARSIPYDITNWIWLTVYEMVLLKIVEEEEMLNSLDYILTIQDDIQKLMRLMRIIKDKEEYGQVLIVGAKLLEQTTIQENKERGMQKQLIKEFAKDSTQDQRIIMFNNRRVTRYYNARYDQSRRDVATIMINASLDSTIALEEGEERARHTTISGEIVDLRIVEPISREKIEAVVDTCIEEIEKIEDITAIAANLYSNPYQEFAYALKVIEKAQKRLNELRGISKKKAQLREQLEELQNKRNELAEKRKTLSDEEEKQYLELYEEVLSFDLDAPSTNFDIQNYDRIDKEQAIQAIDIVLDSKVHLDEKKRLSKEIIENQILSCINIINNFNYLLLIGKHLNNRREHEMVLVVGKKCHKIVNKFKMEKEKRTKLEIPINLLTDEQQNLLSKRQQLSADKLKRFTELQEEYDTLKDNVSSDDPNSFDNYEQNHFEVGKLCLSAAFDSKIAPPLDLNNATLQLEFKPFEDDKIVEVIDNVLEHVHNPANLVSLISLATECPTMTFAFYISDRTHKRISELEKKVDEREMPRLEYEWLKNEKTDLELKEKNLNKEKQEQLEKWQEEFDLFRALNCSYIFQRLDFWDRQHFKVVKKLTTFLLNKKSSLMDERQELLEEELKTGVAPMNLEGSQSERSKDKVDEEINEIDNLIAQEFEKYLKIILNPYHTKKIANLFLNSQEYNYVLRLGESIQNRLVEILEERKGRNLIHEELDKLLNEENELKEQRKKFMNRNGSLSTEQLERKKELSLKTQYFQILPNYNNLGFSEIDNLHLENGTQLISSTFQNKIDSLNELKLNSASELEIEDKVKECDELIAKTIEQSLKYVHYPKHLHNLMNKVATYEADEYVFKIGKQCLEQIALCISKRKAYDKHAVIQTILEHEQNDLEILRKRLPENLQERLDTVKDNMKNSALPYYIVLSNQAQLHEWKAEVCKDLLKYVLEVKSKAQNRIANDTSIPLNEISKILDDSSKLVDEVIQMITDSNGYGVEDPNRLHLLANTLHGAKEYEKVLLISQHEIEVLEILTKEYESNRIPHQQLFLLDAERSQLLKKRKELSLEDQATWRNLLYKRKMHECRPSFVKLTDIQLDHEAYTIGELVINGIIQVRKSNLDRMKTETQVTDEEMKASDDELTKKLEKIVDDVANNINMPENLINLMESLNRSLEYGLVLRVGARAHQILEELKKEVHSIRCLEEERDLLIQSNKIQRSKENDERLVDIELELKTLPVQYNTEGMLDGFTLRVARLLMSASKIEEQDELMKEQAIIIFKIEMTQEAYAEVKSSTFQEDWEPLKEKLIKIVFDSIIEEREKESNQQITSTFGTGTQKTTISQRIELLLNEGMIDKALEVFPAEAPIELVERLWIEVTKIAEPDEQQKQVDSVLPIIQKALLKDFMRFQFDRSKSLLDILESFDKSFLQNLFTKASNSMLVNIVPRQYSSFLDFLRIANARLGGLIWVDFLDDLKKTHKGKKKLMHMVSMTEF